MLHFIQKNDFDLQKTLTTFEYWMWCVIAHLQCPLIYIFANYTSEISVVIVREDLCLVFLRGRKQCCKFYCKYVRTNSKKFVYGTQGIYL